MSVISRLRGFGAIGWLFAILGLFSGIIFQTMSFPTIRCGPSAYREMMNYRMDIALVADLLIFARITIGLCWQEKGLGWIFYGILPWLMVPILDIGMKMRYPEYTCSGC
jgi:hypothetical protein